MGHYSYSCLLTGMPICGGDKIALLPLINNKFGEYAYHIKESKKNGFIYGDSSAMGDGSTNMKYSPFCFPIIGEYNDYGGVKNIQKDENTNLLEEYFELSIEDIVSVITSNRKDTGYSNSLKKLMDPNIEYVYGEPPVYLEKYKELLSLSATWFRGDLYEKFMEVEFPTNYGYDGLTLGSNEFLTLCGFVENGIGGDNRYKRRYVKDGLSLYSDGTTLMGSIYSYDSFKKLCSENNVFVDISEIESKNEIMQCYDYMLPIVQREIAEDEEREATMSDEELFKYKFNKSSYSQDMYNTNMRKVKEMFLSKRSGSKNNITERYIKSAIDGKFRTHAILFNRLDNFMHVCGRYYDLIGDSPQDGDHSEVHKLFELAYSIMSADERIKGYD